MKRACLDSSAWIEISHGGPNAKSFLKAVDDVTQVIVSTITLYEVWKYAMANADESRARQFLGMLQRGCVVSPDPEIAIAAADLSIRHKMAMADSLIYATALAHEALLWTQDEDFKGLPHVKYLAKKKTA